MSNYFVFWNQNKWPVYWRSSLGRKQYVNVNTSFFSSNGLAYFWRAKHKQQIVVYLYFYLPWLDRQRRGIHLICLIVSHNIWTATCATESIAISWHQPFIYRSARIIHLIQMPCISVFNPVVLRYSFSFVSCVRMCFWTNRNTVTSHRIQISLVICGGCAPEIFGSADKLNHNFWLNNLNN